MGLTSVQRAGVLAALQKAVKAALDEERAKADSELRELYEGFGTDRVKVVLNGTEVGSLSLCFSKEEFAVSDREAYEDFMLANGLAAQRKAIRPEYMPEAVRLMEEADPDGVEVRTEVSADASRYVRRVGDVFVLEGTSEPVPGVVAAPREVTGSRLAGCRPDVVVPLVNALPGGVDALLLGGGRDD